VIAFRIVQVTEVDSPLLRNAMIHQSAHRTNFSDTLWDCSGQDLSVRNPIELTTSERRVTAMLLKDLVSQAR
jgi:hypothetical protein